VVGVATKFDVPDENDPLLDPPPPPLLSQVP
jgi:hypothetical protein